MFVILLIFPPFSGVFEESRITVQKGGAIGDTDKTSIGRQEQREFQFDREDRVQGLSVPGFWRTVERDQ